MDLFRDRFPGIIAPRAKLHRNKTNRRQMGSKGGLAVIPAESIPVIVIVLSARALDQFDAAVLKPMTAGALDDNN